MSKNVQKLQTSNKYIRMLRKAKREFKQKLYRSSFALLLSAGVLSASAHIPSEFDYEFSDLNAHIENITDLDDGYQLKLNRLNDPNQIHTKDDLVIQKDFYLSKKDLQNEGFTEGEKNPYSLDDNFTLYITQNEKNSTKNLTKCLGQTGILASIGYGIISSITYRNDKKRIEKEYQKRR